MQSCSSTAVSLADALNLMLGRCLTGIMQYAAPALKDVSWCLVFPPLALERRTSLLLPVQ